MEINSITSLSPEPALHSQRHRHQKNANQPQSVPGTSPTCIWRPHGLLADTGIPPLQLTRYVHLAQLHFRLTITRPDTLPALLFKKLNSFLPLPNLFTPTLGYHIRYATHAFKVDLQADVLPEMISQPTKNHDVLFETWGEKLLAPLWRGKLYNAARTHAGQSPVRKVSYL